MQGLVFRQIVPNGARQRLTQRLARTRAGLVVVKKQDGIMKSFFAGAHASGVSRFTTGATALVAVALALCATEAAAQQKSLKDTVVGAWTIVSSTSQRDDGTATWGNNPKGQLIFTD